MRNLFTMKQAINKLAVAAFVTLTVGVMAPVSANTQLDALLEQVKKDRISEGRMNKKREAEFMAARADKQALLNKAKADLAAEKARGERLKLQYNENEITLAKKEQELINAQGTLGEMFGVVRRTAGNTIGSIATSIISAQYPGRQEVLSKLADAKEIPSLPELEDMWISLQTEMTESSKIVKFTKEITLLDGGSATTDVIRIGNFNLVDSDKYLAYNDQTNQVQPLGRQPEGHVVGTVSTFFNATSGYSPLYVDPSKGQILKLLTQKKTVTEFYHQGGTVGYVITGVLIFGLIIALERLVVLGMVGAKMRGQLKNIGSPKDDNPLGRILKVYQSNKSSDVENLELKLDEAILKETPKIERGVSIIKILAAIAPLLGLLGTVVGMIGTFQSITLFGTGDPKIMAGDISMALVTTALGLIAALPLIFVHSIVAARSKSIVHILDEQTAGIIAAHAEKE